MSDSDRQPGSRHKKCLLQDESIVFFLFLRWALFISQGHTNQRLDTITVKECKLHAITRRDGTQTFAHRPCATDQPHQSPVNKRTLTLGVPYFHNSDAHLFFFCYMWVYNLHARYNWTQKRSQPHSKIQLNPIQNTPPTSRE